jgi:hypothetical protein
MSCCVANATIDYNAVTFHTKPVDQQGFVLLLSANLIFS